MHCLSSSGDDDRAKPPVRPSAEKTLRMHIVIKQPEVFFRKLDITSQVTGQVADIFTRLDVER
jgi:hypothetical protein